MYYIIETNYAGPNPDQNVDADTIEIRTKPGITNSSREERTEGWLGQTNDWSRYALGEYETEEAAMAAITEKFGDTHTRDEDGDIEPWDREQDGTIYRCRPGKYAPMGEIWSKEWAYTMRDDIAADTTDEAIEQMVKEAEQELQVNESSQLDTAAVELMLEEYRDELRAEADSEEE